MMLVVKEREYWLLYSYIGYYILDTNIGDDLTSCGNSGRSSR